MNNRFENTETTIKKDVREVFEEIWQELNSTYFTSDKFDLSYIRETIVKRLETSLINKNLLLVDTVLIYLAKDARQALGDTDSKVINQFHEWNRQQAEKLKNEFKNELQPRTVTLPTDTRIISSAVGAGTGATGAIGTMLVSRAIALAPEVGGVATLSPLLLPIGFLLSAVAGYLVYKATYRVSSSWAIEQLKKEIEGNLQLVEKMTTDRLLKIVEEYKQDFCSLPNS